MLINFNSRSYFIFRKNFSSLISSNKVAPELNAQILHLVACLDKTDLMALIHTYVIKASFHICWQQWRIEARYVWITYFTNKLNLFSYKFHISYCVISCIKLKIQGDKTGDVRMNVTLTSFRVTIFTFEKQ